MVSRITRILIILQIAVAAILFALATSVWHFDNQTLALIFGVGSIFVFRLLITANNFFLAWIYRSETPSSRRINRRQICRLFVGELHATLVSSSWSMPFHSFDKRSATNPIGLPVLLIHGYGCNSGYWHPMSKMLMQAKITHYAVDLEPLFADIDSYVPAVHRVLEALCNESGHSKIIIVAHSMGGLVARAYLREHGDSRIAKVITLGTPHRGTALANFATGVNSMQMSWKGSVHNGVSSDWLRKLEATEDMTIQALFVSIYSHHDNIVAPQSSSHLVRAAANIEFHGIGHVALARNPAIQAQVIEEIRRTSSQSIITSAAIN